METMPDEVATTDQADRSEGGNAATRAQESAKEVMSEAQEKARDTAGQARGVVREQIDRRSTHVGEQISSSAGDVHVVADELRKQGKESPARYVDQVADRAERLGGYLRDTDANRILDDVEGYGRRNTWAVAVGGLAVGFAASRLLKASSGRRYRSSVGMTATGAGDSGPRASQSQPGGSR
jgi:hypothetical protein